MYHLSVRNIQTELLDEGRLPTDEVRRALMDIRRINRRFGARSSPADPSGKGNLNARFERIHCSGCRQRFLGDHPMAIIDWAKQHGLRAQVFALDFQHRHLAAVSR